MKKIFFYLILFSGIIFTLYYISLEPTIKPADIIIEAQLTPISNMVSNDILPSTNCNFILDITLNKNTSKMIFEDNKYLYTIYPYISGNSNPYWQMENENDYSIGSEGETAALAIHQLKKERIIENSADFNFLNELFIEGFKYNGKTFPAKIRFYMDIQKPLNNEKNVVVYTHWEKRLGKNLSWSMIIPVD